ncbi:MAG: outer membrane protein assembly factor BamD [Helicobacteraceae bacterium]|nr:outer membrane protein assembly factor BamD [Helicobacteraceae bacterium]
MFKKILLAAVLLFFVGCSNKELAIYNKPAIFWYESMLKSIAKNDLEKADGFYNSLQSEHIGSPLLPGATLVLAQAHMYSEEYILSEYFLDEYIKRFADETQREYAEFLKIKSKYMALPNPRRDQGLINEAIKDGEVFKATYPNSMFYYVVDTMVTRLYLADASLNESIADLYERLDKPFAAQFYRGIEPQPWIEWSKVEKPDLPWYKEWFEGDGKSSWYGFLIPDTHSVIAQNDGNTSKNILPTVIAEEINRRGVN